MMWKGNTPLLLVASAFVCCPTLSAALPKNHTDDQVEAAIDAGTFKNPSNNVRPYFRYWLPDASINTTNLASDILALAVRGAGGIEFLNYYNYGGTVAPPATDWNIYGYGTPAYRKVLKTALETHNEHGLKMDYCMGPQSGQGVPAHPEAEGLERNLYSYNITLGKDLSYNGQIPGWGLGELVSVTSFAIVNETSLKFPAASAGLLSTLLGSPNYTQLTISSDSLTDWTDSVSATGHLRLTAKPVAGATSYLLYTSYSRRSYDRADANHTATPQNIIQNGSFAVDHFSVVGAKLTTDFLERHILIDGIKELMMETGNYIWEDSVEVPGTTYWTPALLGRFESQYGYSIRKYTPLLAGNNGYQSGTFGTTIVSDASDHGYGIVGDFRNLLTLLYAEYLQHFVTWSNEYLNLQFSAQIGYNQPVDMLADVPNVNAPECETLSFSNTIDAYRQYSGPANLAGKRIISIELGADFFYTYSQTLFQLLDDAKKSFTGGVNRVVIHGAEYSHDYVNTTWPGYTSFEYAFAGHHSRHQPAWDVGYPQALNWFARMQYILQSGVPKVDLVFWDKRTAELGYPTTLYGLQDLTDGGYSYSYLSPDNFVLETAFVQNATLAPTRQAFQAMILRSNDTMTIDGASGLAKLANDGLPIIIAGGLPTIYNTENVQQVSASKAQLQGILSLPNVHQVPLGPLAPVVAGLGFEPRTVVSSNGTWLTRWLETSSGDTYVYLYYDGVDDPTASTTGTVAFASTKTPYFLDAWTGAITPIVQYTIENGRTVIPFTLLNQQTAIIMFAKSCKTLPAAPKVYVTAAPASVVGYDSSSSGVVLAKVAKPMGSTAQSLTLSNGSTVSLSRSTAPAAFSLKKWTLIVEKWLSPHNRFDAEIQARKINATFHLLGPALPSWPTIAGLTNTSGIGYYSASFSWKKSGGNLGAMLTVPPVAQGLEGRVNGKRLSTLDITNPTADISEFLVSGSNTIELISSTTLFNTLRPLWDTLQTGGTLNAIQLATLEAVGVGGEQPEGIIGEVVITPYHSVPLS